MSILVATKVLGQFLKVMQLSRSSLPHSCAHIRDHIICQFFLICPSDKRGVAQEQIDPKTQGPTNVPIILNDLLDFAPKIFVLLSEIMKQTKIPKLRVGTELKVLISLSGS